MKYDRRQTMDGRRLLAMLDDDSVPLVILDPQYRTLLDRQAYGNEGERESRRHALKAMPDNMVRDFTWASARVLRPSGHLMMWCDKFAVGSGHHVSWVPHGLGIVDLIAWNKGRFGMGRRARCMTEYLVVMQKEPARAKGVWHTHTLGDCVTQPRGRSAHPHAKPVELQRRLIEAVTVKGDTVVDPAAGSYSVMKAAHACGRIFLGCDIAGAAR